MIHYIFNGPTKHGMAKAWVRGRNQDRRNKGENSGDGCLGTLFWLALIVIFFGSMFGC